MHVERRERWVAFCARYGFNHTSLAVGDVILDQEQGKYWLVTSGRRYYHIDFVLLPKTLPVTA
jgi:hypothetical protein